MQIENKRIVITGAASGIGHALLTLLSAHPCQILAVDRDAVTLPEGVAQISSYQADLSQPQAIDDLLNHALNSFGAVDVFIANAGFAYYEHFHQPDWEHIEHIFRVNVFSPLYTVAKMQAINPDREHMVVMTASAMANVPIPGYALYAATKAALHQFAWAYRYEQPPHARLMLVYPIATRTGFFNNAANQTPTLYPNQTAEYVARRILQGIVQNKRHIHPSLGFRAFYRVGRVFPIAYHLYQMYAAWLFRRWQRANQP